MLNFRINNKSLLLDESSSVRLSWSNPACYYDKIPGDVGMGLSIPVNDHNRALLGFPERFEIDISEDMLKFPGFEVRFSGVLLLSGCLSVQSCDGSNYSCWLQSELGVLGEKLQNKKITDFNWPVNQNFSNKSNYDDATDNYGMLPIINRGFWSGVGKQVEDTVSTPDGNRNQTISKLQKEHFQNFGYWVNLPDLVEGYKISGNGCVVSPFLYLRYVLKEALRLNGFFVNRNDLLPTCPGASLAFEKNLMIYNNFNIMGASFSEQSQIVESWDYENQSIADATYNIITVTSWGLVPFNYSDLLPKISFKEFILGIQNALNFIFRFRSDRKVDIIDRNAIFSKPYIDVDSFLVGLWQKKDFQFRRLKFSPELDKDDAIFGSGFEDLTARLADFGQPVATYADLLSVQSPVPGELRLVTSLNRIYEYKWLVVAAENVSFAEQQMDSFGWEVVSIGTQPYIFNPSADASEDIKVNCSTLSKSNGSIPGTSYLQANQKGNFAQMKSTFTNFTFRLLPGSTLLWPNGMEWEGDTGLFKTRWNNWSRFWSKRQGVSGKFNFSANALVYVADNITSKFRTSKGEFLIEEMECEFSLNSIGITTIKGYKI